jgi:putative membrane protein
MKSTSPPVPAKTLLAEERTSLALDRTSVARERTLMAWIRTAVSLISFGFTVYKFFQYLHEGQPGSQTSRLMGPRGFALVMIGIGVVALVLATLHHGRHMKTIYAHYERRHPLSGSQVIPVAWTVSMLGAAAFVLVFLHQ